MEPYIHDGDTVYVRRDAELSIGDVGIFCVDGAMYCKQYYLDENRNLILVSANPDLRDTNVFVGTDSGHSVQACGKVLLDVRLELPDYLFED
jgi:phage repressor protein C with HTH and peptisase S24 domain